MSETVSIDEPDGEYMEMVEYRNSARGHSIALEKKKCYGRLLRDDDTRHNQEAEGIWKSGLF